VSADLLLLAAFLGVMALFGRSFAKLNLGGDLYVTEPVLLAVLGLALLRVGFRGAMQRVRDVVPLVPLVILWIAGAVATLRGIADFGLTDVTHDVGLVEYSVMLALVPIVADSRERLRLLLTVLLASSVVAALLYASYWAVPPNVAPGLWPNPDPAAAIYISIFLVWAATRAVHGMRLHRAEWALFLLGTTLLSLMTARSVWVAMLVVVAILAALAPDGRRLRVLGAGIAVFVFSNVAAYGVTQARAGWANAPAAVSSATASPNYVADDGMSGLVGQSPFNRLAAGQEVDGDAAQGSLSRRVGPGQLLDLANLAGLQRRHEYSVLFWLKPLRAQPAAGQVGDTSGAGWSAKPWSASPATRWQTCKEVLSARSSAERLDIANGRSSPPVLVDGLRVIKGRISQGRPGGSCGHSHGPLPGGSSPTPTSSSSANGALGATPGIIAETQGTFTPGIGAGANANASWRLAINWFMLKETAKSPLFGVGFGRPTDFEFDGVVYDRRTGDPDDPNDVTGPHDSFMNLLYRAGLLGMIPFVALLLVAISRVRRSLFAAPPPYRARVVAATTTLAFVATIALLDVVLEGPQMGLFFWGGLALLFLAPRMTWRSAGPRETGRRKAS